MGAYKKTVITNAGQSLIAQAIAGQGVINWTNMQASDYAIPSGTDPATLTALQSVKQTATITGAGVYGGNVLQVSALFDNSGVSVAYNIETLGVWGRLGSGTETLIAVVQAVTPDVMPVFDANSPASYIFNVQMTVSNAASVTMAVNTAGTATVADLQNLQAALEAEIATAKTIRTGTFTAAGWSASAPYQQTISVTGITAGMHPGWELNTTSLDPATLEALMEARNCITYLVCGAGTIKAVCGVDKPAIDLPLFFKGD